MSISKISRSIVVVIFIAIIIVLGYLDILAVFKSNSQDYFSPGWLKYIYPVLALVIFSTYVYIKDKTNKLKVSRKISLIYRYAYLIVAITLARIYALRQVLTTFPNWLLVMGIFMGIISAIILKKIVFNVSKSDILSILALSLLALTPNILKDVSEFIVSNALLICVLAFVLLIQHLIDELKQQGIKNSKYLYISMSAAVFVGISIVLGFNAYIYVVLFATMLFVTENLDKTSLYLGKGDNPKNKLNFIYSIERLKISKLFIAIILIIFISYVVILICNFGVYYLSGSGKFAETLETINANKNIIDFNNFDISRITFSGLIKELTVFVGTSKLFYLISISYILFIEILNFALRRRYDTKSTIIKLIFTLTCVFLAASNLIIIYQPTLIALLILISVVNTSNIYLNREERVKLLNASNQ